MKVVRSDSGDIFFETYYKALEESFQKYSGQFSDIVKHIPSMLMLFLKLHREPVTPKKSKQIINAVITYLISPYDVVPEENLGLYAFIDDMFLCTFALIKLEDQLGREILEKNWNQEEDLMGLVETIYKRTKILLGRREKEILEFAGI